LTLAINEKLVPTLLDSSSPLSKSVTLLIRPYNQPWHAAGTFPVEAALAFGKSSSGSSPAIWWAYWVKLMREQEAWFDNPVKNKTPEQVRDELAKLAGDVLQEQEAIKGPVSKAVGEVRALISVQGSSPNAG
jgi:hypothetical protein